MGYEVFVPRKNDSGLYDGDLGVVIYCAGYGDCAGNPRKVIESNISSLIQIIERSSFRRLIYLSSTRLYLSNDRSSEEADLLISSSDKRRLFNLTKLVAEEMCLLSDREIVIIRPSNIYGLAVSSPLYLPSIVRDAIHKKKVNMYVSKDYAKDYVSVMDVANSIYQLSLCDRLDSKIYNVGSGINISSREIAEVLSRETDCEIIWHKTPFNEEVFPETDISKLVAQIDFSPRSVLDDLPKLITEFKQVSSR